jgi:signal transduction histidine kinase
VSDSLERVLANYKKEDTIKVNILYNLAAYLIDTNTTSSLQYVREGLRLSRKLNVPAKVALGNLILANIYGSVNNKLDSAVFVSLEGLEIAERLHLDQRSLQFYQYLGGCYRLLGNFDKAEYYDNKSLDAYTSQKNDTLILRTLQELLAVYSEKNQRDKVKLILNRALPMAAALKDEYVLGMILWNKAGNDEYEGNFQLALNSLHKALAIWKKLIDYHGIAYSLFSISSTYLQMNNKDSAGWYAYSALDTAKKYHLEKETRDAYSALFNFHYHYKDYKKALEERLILDSIQNEFTNSQTGQTTMRAEMQYEQEKKNLLASIAQERKEAAARRERILVYTIISAFVLLAAFLIYNNRQKQRANIRIEKAYGELKTTQAKLIQSEKMASLGELTAGIAHEIQNPLNFVNNFSEVNEELLNEMKEEMDKGNYTEARLVMDNIIDNEHKIKHHGHRADSIVKGMLLHSRETKGEKESRDLNALAEEYLRLSYQGLRAKDKSFNASLKTQFDPTIGKVSISQDFARVLLNLYNNAFYAVSEKKKGMPENYEPTVSISTQRVNGKVEISVKDNGTGIPENIKEKIFQPFFTTKPTGQGTGLGLSLSYDIVRAHGGEISVNNKDGQGTEFVVQLPA